MKRLILLLFLAICASPTQAQTCTHISEEAIKFYCNDSMHIESTRYDRDTQVLTWYEDQTNDGIRFTLKRNQYTMYVPELNTIYRVQSMDPRCSVSNHFLYLLDMVRVNKQRSFYFLTQQKP